MNIFKLFFTLSVTILTGLSLNAMLPSLNNPRLPVILPQKPLIQSRVDNLRIGAPLMSRNPNFGKRMVRPADKPVVVPSPIASQPSESGSEFSSDSLVTTENEQLVNPALAALITRGGKTSDKGAADQPNAAQQAGSGQFNSGAVVRHEDAQADQPRRNEKELWVGFKQQLEDERNDRLAKAAVQQTAINRPALQSLQLAAAFSPEDRARYISAYQQARQQLDDAFAPIATVSHFNDLEGIYACPYTEEMLTQFPQDVSDQFRKTVNIQNFENLYRQATHVQPGTPQTVIDGIRLNLFARRTMLIGGLKKLQEQLEGQAPKTASSSSSADQANRA